jgi:hypothetical protein
MEQDFPRRGKPQFPTPRPPLKERRLELVLEQGDLTVEGGGRYIDALRGLPE